MESWATLSIEDARIDRDELRESLMRNFKRNFRQDEAGLQSCLMQPLMEKAALTLQSRMESQLKIRLAPTWHRATYWKRGQSIRPHLNGAACEVTAMVRIASASETAWPIILDEATMEEDQVFVYRATELVMSRPPLEKEWELIGEFHFVDMQGPHFPSVAYDKSKHHPVPLKWKDHAKTKNYAKTKAIKLPPEPVSNPECEINDAVLISYWGTVPAETCDAIIAALEDGTVNWSVINTPHDSCQWSSGISNHQDLDQALFKAFNRVLLRYKQQVENIDNDSRNEISIRDDEGYVTYRLREDDHIGTQVYQSMEKNTIQASRLMSAILFLNDDFEGGDHYFPLQDAVIKPRCGTMVFFPSTYTHPHRVDRVTKGTSYYVMTHFR